MAPEDLTLGLPLHTNLTTAVYRTPSSWSHHTIDITFERLGTESFLFMVETYRGSDRLTFKYDYMGRRVEKCVYSGNILTSRTLFVYDGFKCVEELDALNNSVVSLRHAWQPFDAGLDVILATADGNATSFFLHDANKNVMQKTGDNGTFQENYAYAPFGENTDTASADIGFSSEAFDALTAVNYYNYHYLIPYLGRWQKRDVFFDSQQVEISFSLNLYAEIDNYPLYAFDYLDLYGFFRSGKNQRPISNIPSPSPRKPSNPHNPPAPSNSRGVNIPSVSVPSASSLPIGILDQIMSICNYIIGKNNTKKILKAIIEKLRRIGRRLPLLLYCVYCLFCGQLCRWIYYSNNK